MTENTVEQSGVIRWDPSSRGREDAGAAGRGGLSVQQEGWQTNYYDPALASQGLATDNRSIGTQSTRGLNQLSLAEQMAALASMYGGSTGGGTSGATQLGYAELAYKKAKDAQDRQDALAALGYDRAQSARILGGMENYYTSGQYGKGFDDLLNMINEQGKVSETGVRDAYGRAMTNIGQGYDVASGLGTAGYEALNRYLAQNQNNPYAGMQATAGTAPDALTDYLSAYGVSDQPVQGQIQADQLQAQQGAANYQNLINLLGGVAQQGAASRGAESQMAQLLFNTGLGQERAGYQGQAANAQAQALAALQQQLFQSRFGVQSDRNSLANQLAQQIVQAGGSLSGGTSGSGIQQPVVAPSSVEQILQEIAARQEAGTQTGGLSGGIAPGLEAYAI